ncbi:uncharacterized protein M421DRAFT_93600 [Didymella exigua CBS 183.55]|uniref:Uncharacterized protein n=1 Tax=Didymella exigua CBS 183.55 TaxID=1150837 RepID=A0A6A5RJ91_9PLEO|nr:uncharacterized protein M421DRAFT_93600 [Didymella exigua CBS 183.55]KAF1927034.1 hypothetical protein M421DRAFT_93600 [Didymella exigua CBS 183.55]
MGAGLDEESRRTHCWDDQQDRRLGQKQPAVPDCVAATASGDKSIVLGAFDQDDQNDDADNNTTPNVALTDNMRPDQRDNDPTLQVQYPPLFVKTKQTTCTDVEGSIGRWLLTKTVDDIREVNDHPKTEVTFSDHVNNFIQLVKATHSSEDKNKAHKTLQHYVVLASTAKMYGQVKRGKERNLFKYIKKHGDEIHAAGEADIFHEVLRQAKLLNKSLSRKQTKIIADVIERLASSSAMSQHTLIDSKQRATIAETDTMTAELQDLKQDIDGGNPIVYTVGSCRDQRRSEVAVSDDTETERNIESEVGRETLLGDLSKILNALTQEASIWLRLFTILKEQLREYVVTSLGLIQTLFELTSSNLPQYPELPAGSTTPLPPKKSEISSSEKSDSSISEIEEGFEKTKIDPDEDGEPSFLDAKEGVKMGDGRFDVIGPHFSALYGSRVFDELKEPDRTRSENGRVDQEDQGRPLTDEKFQKIERWLDEKGYGFAKQKLYTTTSENRSFTRTYHCETISMRLFLLATNRAKFVEKTVKANDGDYKNSQRILPPKEVTDALLNTMNILPVSKRCCPTCDALVEFIRAGIKLDILYLGNYTIWSAIALPPWIPKEPRSKSPKSDDRTSGHARAPLLTLSPPEGRSMSDHFFSDAFGDYDSRADRAAPGNRKTLTSGLSGLIVSEASPSKALPFSAGPSMASSPPHYVPVADDSPQGAIGPLPPPTSSSTAPALGAPNLGISKTRSKLGGPSAEEENAGEEADGSEKKNDELDIL